MSCKTELSLINHLVLACLDQLAWFVIPWSFKSKHYSSFSRKTKLQIARAHVTTMTRFFYTYLIYFILLPPLFSSKAINSNARSFLPTCIRHWRTNSTWFGPSSILCSSSINSASGDEIRSMSPSGIKSLQRNLNRSKRWLSIWEAISPSFSLKRSREFIVLVKIMKSLPSMSSRTKVKLWNCQFVGNPP